MSTSFMEAMGGDSIESAAQRVASHIENTIDTADIYNKLTQNGKLALLLDSVHAEELKRDFLQALVQFPVWETGFIQKVVSNLF